MTSATRSLPILSLQAAEAAALISQEKAKELGIDVNIAIVDSTLHLLHFTRMPTAKFTSISIAINKAFTAAGHRLPTSHYNSPTFFPGRVGWGVKYSDQGRFCTSTGGVPIFVDGEVVGAIGVSSGSAGEDVEVAEAGSKAVEVMVGRARGAKLQDVLKTEMVLVWRFVDTILSH